MVPAWRRSPRWRRHRGLPLRREAPLTARWSGGARVRARLQRRAMPLQGDRGQYVLSIDFPAGFSLGTWIPPSCSTRRYKRRRRPQGPGRGAPRTGGEGRVISSVCSTGRRTCFEVIDACAPVMRPNGACSYRAKFSAVSKESIERAMKRWARPAAAGARRRRQAGARPQGWRGVYRVPNQVLPGGTRTWMLASVRPVPDPDVELRRAEAPGDCRTRRVWSLPWRFGRRRWARRSYAVGA